jgi:hypothetical protein
MAVMGAGAMDEAYLGRLVGHLRQRGFAFEPGLSSEEVIRIERTYGFRFPPDLQALLRYALPVGGDPTKQDRYDAAGRRIFIAGTGWNVFPNWRRGPEAELREKLAWPLEGILFDIEHSTFWDPAWGPKPASLEDAFAIARREVAKVPVLIPVYSHRYLPAEPEAAGNPVLSVYQTDIIYYGNDLASYFSREFGMELPSWAATSPRPIRFWSELTS